MFRVSIKDISNNEKFTAEYPTMEAIENFINTNKEISYFGKNERLVAEFDLEKYGEDKNKATGFTTENINGEMIKVYHFNAEYIIDIQDISTEFQMRKKVQDRYLKRSFGEKMIDKISAINDSKNLSVLQVDEFMSNALITSLREHLWAGNISTFVSKLDANDVSLFFTNVEKANVITECQQFLLSLEE